MHANLPRLCAGEISDWYTGTMVESMPTPSPATTLPNIIVLMLAAKVCNAPPMQNIIDPYNIVFRRPTISPIRPTARDETKAPISRMATMVPTKALDGSLKCRMKNVPLVYGLKSVARDPRPS